MPTHGSQIKWVLFAARGESSLPAWLTGMCMSSCMYVQCTCRLRSGVPSASKLFTHRVNRLSAAVALCRLHIKLTTLSKGTFYMRSDLKPHFKMKLLIKITSKSESENSRFCRVLLWRYNNKRQLLSNRGGSFSLWYISVFLLNAEIGTIKIRFHIKHSLCWVKVNSV